MGSAAKAWLEAVARRPSAVAPSSFRTDQKAGDRDVFAMLFLSTGLALNSPAGILTVPAHAASETEDKSPLESAT
jgi:hypothetical protein